jgi:predicted protein tyrosine phosphatase
LELAGKLRALDLSKADVILVKDWDFAEELSMAKMPWLKKKIQILCIKDFDDVKTMDEAAMNKAGWFKRGEVQD